MTINDLPEPPSAPTLTVTGTTFDSANLEWNEPENTGPPITGYNLQYRQGDSGGFNNAEDPGLNRSQTIPQLEENTRYQARVQAANDEGQSPWSNLEDFTTNANQAPVFTPPGAASIPEGAAAGVTVVTVSAQDPDGHGVSYFLSGSPPFTIGASTGEITTVDHPYDHETQPEHQVTVIARDTLGGSALLSLTIGVENVDEDPTGLPVITGIPRAGQTLSAEINGIEDPDGTPAPEDFSYRWLQDGEAIPGATQPSLQLDSSHLGHSISVQVAFTDGGGFQETLTSLPVDASAQTPAAPVLNENQAPAWNGNTRLGVEENQTLVVNQLTASDPDVSDAITAIRISGGEDAHLFRAEADTGAGTLSLSFLEPPDHERPGDHDGNNRYLVTLEAVSGEGERGEERHHPGDHRGAGRAGAAPCAHAPVGAGHHPQIRQHPVGTGAGGRRASHQPPHAPLPGRGGGGGVEPRQRPGGGDLPGTGRAAAPHPVRASGAGGQRRGQQPLVGAA